MKNEDKLCSLIVDVKKEEIYNKLRRDIIPTESELIFLADYNLLSEAFSVCHQRQIEKENQLINSTK